MTSVKHMVWSSSTLQNRSETLNLHTHPQYIKLIAKNFFVSKTLSIYINNYYHYHLTYMHTRFCGAALSASLSNPCLFYHLKTTISKSEIVIYMHPSDNIWVKPAVLSHQVLTIHICLLLITGHATSNYDFVFFMLNCPIWIILKFDVILFI